jgi:hypothetical protein
MFLNANASWWPFVGIIKKKKKVKKNEPFSDKGKQKDLKRRGLLHSNMPASHWNEGYYVADRDLAVINID